MCGSYRFFHIFVSYFFISFRCVFFALPVSIPTCFFAIFFSVSHTRRWLYTGIRTTALRRNGTTTARRERHYRRRGKRFREGRGGGAENKGSGIIARVFHPFEHTNTFSPVTVSETPRLCCSGTRRTACCARVRFSERFGRLGAGDRKAGLVESVFLLPRRRVRSRRV